MSKENCEQRQNKNQKNLEFANELCNVKKENRSAKNCDTCKR
ncbi:MAG: hypothetical protein E6X17_08730 [Sporomusaceae bacterium]|nr:hypothetical protein [Sporomusaceae bacterium]